MEESKSNDQELVLANNKRFYGNYQATRRKARTNASQYREGPIPVDELQNVGMINNGMNQLDSDMEDNQESELNLKNSESLAGSRGLLMYFARLGKSTEKELVDFHFVDTLIQAGANINFTDRHGQTILHTVSRDWNPDVAKFLIERGALVNAADKYGRTPLHVAAAYDHFKMVEFLAEKGGRIEAKTLGELQTVLHYAAKKNSMNSLKALLKLGADINARDYRNRTPLFIATELGRNESVKYLLEYGAPAGVYDTGGTSALAMMVEKMPENAKSALDQFVIVDGALRKTYYYLNYLESDKKKQKLHQKMLAKTPLELIVLYKELDLITNPVVQKLMSVKWKMFGFKYTMLSLLLNLTYTFIWTGLGFTLPRSGGFYDNLSGDAWKLALECIIILLTLYFIFQQIISMRKLQSNYTKWKDWKIREIERDLNYCHPRYPDERRFLMNEIQRVREYKGGFFQSFWNVFEWLCLISILALMATRGAYTYMLAHHKDSGSVPKLLDAHKIIFALTLLLVWLRMMRVFRGFAFLAAFITLLSHVASETLRFTFLFFEFFIPFVCTFWMFFGGSDNAKIIKKAGDEDNFFSTIQQTAMTVWSLTLIGDHPFQGMVAINEVLTQILLASYWAVVSLVCVNLYIALMSETFSRVYANAQANADLQQASLLIGFEDGLRAKERKNLLRYINRQCNPLEEFSVDLGKSSTDADAVGNMLDSISKEVDRIQNKMDESQADLEVVNENMEDNLKGLQDELEVLKMMVGKLLGQQNDMIQQMQTSGIRKVVNQGGEAIENFKVHFSRLISRKQSVETTHSVATTESSFSDDAAHTASAQSSPELSRKRTKRKSKRPSLRRKTLKRTSSEPENLNKFDK